MKKTLLWLGSLFFAFCLCGSVLAESDEPKHIAAGRVYSLFIDSTGQLWAWGRSRLSLDHDEKIPRPVAEKVRSVYVKADGGTSFFIREDGSLWGWGESDYGQLGIVQGLYSQKDGYVRQPRKVMDHVKTISGSETIFAIKENGSLWTWGGLGLDNANNPLKNRAYPRKVMDNVTQVSSAFAHTVVKKTDGTLWAWGDNQCGALGTGNTEESEKPVRVNTQPLGKRSVVQIATRWGETYLLADDGTVWYSGEYNIHQAECLDPPHLIPTKLDTIDNVKAIALGQFHELFLKKDGSVWASGYGIAATAPLMTVPTEPGKVMEDVVEMAGGQSHSIALKKDGTVWVWGENDVGQLGNGTTVGSITPVQVHFPKP